MSEAGKRPKGYVAPESEEGTAMVYTHFNYLDAYTFLKEECRILRDQWFQGKLDERGFNEYRCKLMALGVMQMWSWNYFAEESYVLDPERDEWWKEIPSAEET